MFETGGMVGLADGFARVDITIGNETDPKPGAPPMARSSPEHTPAFTLTELMATLATVGLITLLAVPSMSETRNRAQARRSVANLKLIAQASMVHAAGDPQESAIPVHALMGQLPGAEGAVEFGGKAGIGESFSTSILDSKWGTAYGRGPASRPLNPLLFRGGFPDFKNNPGPNQINWLLDTQLELPVFRAPADTGYSGHHYAAWHDSALTSYDHYGNSYCAPNMWIGVPGGNCRLTSNSAILHAVSAIPNPATTLYFMENAGRFAWRKNFGSDGCSSLAPGLALDVEEPVNGWYGMPWQFAASFVDGHASLTRIEGHQMPQPTLRSYPDLFGQPTTHSFWHCTIIRGPDWQLDTLPAPPVPTIANCFVAPLIVVQ